MASESMEWTIISRTSSMNSDVILVDIPDDDEFDKCPGTPQIAAEHANAIAFSGISFPDSTNTRLSAEHKTKDAVSQDLEKSKAKPTPAPVRFEEDNMQVFIRGIFEAQEKTLVLEVEKSDTVDDVKSNHQGDGHSKGYAKTAPCMLVTARRRNAVALWYWLRMHAVA